MSERRMLSRSVTESDMFLDLPISAQGLYFHLSMNADDEGFINNSKRIRSICGASEDDLQQLIHGGFLIRFDSGVCVITHWKINNKLRKDRCRATNYPEEKALLVENASGVYSLQKGGEKPAERSEEIPAAKTAEETLSMQEPEAEVETKDSGIDEIAIESEHESEKHSDETDVNKSFSEMIFDIYFSHGLPCGKNIIEFTMRDFNHAANAVKRLQLRSEDVIQAVRNYAYVIDLKRKGLTWWNSEQNFYSFCDKNTILRFLPENFKIEEYTKQKGATTGAGSALADRIEL